MKWTLNSLLVLALLSHSCSSKKEVRSFSVIRFEEFLTRDARQMIPKDTIQYLILEPSLCVSCVAYQIRKTAAHSSRHQLKIIAAPEQVPVIKNYTADIEGTCTFVSNFDKRKLARQIFLKNDLAFAVSYGNRVQTVMALNNEALKSFE